jgi:hypothetical protein
MVAFAHAAAGLSVPGWRLAWQICGNVVFTIATVEALRRFAGLPLHCESRRQFLRTRPSHSYYRRCSV